MVAETIMCGYCRKRVTIVEAGVQSRLAQHDDDHFSKPCRGSNAVIKGEWRDDPTYRKEHVDG